MRPTPPERFQPADPSRPPATPQPTRARHIVVGFVIALAIITYIDRVCISQAAPDIRRDLGLNEVQMGAVFSAFTLAYALFEVPAGWMGDRFGPRGALMKVVVLWSIFTAATGWAWNFVSLVVCRTIFGVGEAGCFPNATKIFTIWLPSRERLRAQGLLWLSARWGGAFTPPLVAWVMGYVNWRVAFMLFGALGIVWAAGFFRWFRDRPREHPAVNAAELALLDGAEINAPRRLEVPWGRLLTSRTVWLLWLQYFCMSYGWYFYVTWLPTYLRQARGVPLAPSAWLAGLPLFFGGIGCIVGGWLARQLAARWGDVRRARRVSASGGLFFAAAMLLLATRIESPLWAMIALGMASFANDLAMAPDWGACMDVGGPFAGSLSGSMNMMGNIGGAVGPLVVGFILGHTKSSPTAPPTAEGWTLAFLLAAVVYAIGGFAWLFIDPATPISEAGTKS
ncbi:MAG TPA: MFS transporter [Candidatus Paceibacterota bacterium]|nr:MFS transporter [Candidatus Paceibacterota bacterium]